MRGLLRAFAVGLAILAPIEALGAENSATNFTNYSFNIPKLYPNVYAKWKKETSNFGDGRWLSTWDGVSAPIQDIRVEGPHWKFATVCKPHFCDSDWAALLFDPKSGIMFGVVQVSTPMRMRVLVGDKPDLRQAACLEALIRYNGDLSSC